VDEEAKKEVAMFRYGVISEFVNGRSFLRGEKERLLREKCAQEWRIPGSDRSRISRTVLKDWLKTYLESDRRLESLLPKERNDIGKMRSVDTETVTGLLHLRKEMADKPMPVLLKEARDRGIIQQGTFISRPTLYRIFKHHAEELKKPPEDRRKFEAEHINDLWQSDVMHGPMVLVEGKQRKAYLIAVIDDHSRFIIHAQFYLSEGVDAYLEFLRKAFLKRGIPRKLYVDNGSAFRSKQLGYCCAGLGIALIHAKPYQPEGKGKIERWFRTVRMTFLSGIKKEHTLESLNKELDLWLEKYQDKIHLAIKEKPCQRFMRGVDTLTPAPNRLDDYFRKIARRSVRQDRTVAFQGKLYEAPVELVGKQIQLLYHLSEPASIEIVCQGKSFGILRLVDVHVNYRVSREKDGTKLISTPSAEYAGGILFEGKNKGVHHE
jgi:transposase InsO family protein